MMKFKIKGIEGIKQRLDMIWNAIRADIQTGLYDASKYLRYMSINHIRALARFPNLSIDGQSITDIANWSITRNSPYSVSLSCNSKHAAIVEFGSLSGIKVNAYNYGHKAWPILQQQGFKPVYRKTFTIQQGYHYLESSMMNLSVQHRMLKIVGNHVEKLIRGIGV